VRAAIFTDEIKARIPEGRARVFEEIGHAAEN
jgi:hypothetical protein